MEPMTLGSPTTSPITGPTFATPNAPMSQQSYSGTPVTHHGVGGAGHPGGFLPGYLMGEHAYQQSPSHATSTPTGGNAPGAGSRMFSPTKLNRSLSQHQQQQPHTPYKTNPQGFLTPTTTPGNRNTPSATTEKPGGPPKTGLFAQQQQSSTPGKFGTPRLYSTPVPTTPQLSFGATPYAGGSGVREEVMNQSSSCSSDQASTWVTVFGFPPSSAGYILSQFSQYGNILQHHTPANGNWMHIKYQTKLQAQKALAKSNRVLGGSIMIGVSACTDPNVEEKYGSGGLNASSVMLDQSYSQYGRPGPSSSFMAPPSANNSVMTLNSSLGGAANLNRSLRPLTQAYKAANAENEILNRTHTPNKSTGFVSKAMEYIFGW